MSQFFNQLANAAGIGGITNNGLTLQSNGTGHTWAQQPQQSGLMVTDNKGKQHNLAKTAQEVEFLAWFIDAYYPQARDEFKAIQDIKDKVAQNE